jgi:hypothetical protein
LDGSTETKSDGENFCLKGPGTKFIHKELVSTLLDNAISLHDNAMSLSTVKNWLGRFKSCGLSAGTKNGLEDL